MSKKNFWVFLSLDFPYPTKHRVRKRKREWSTKLFFLDEKWSWKVVVAGTRKTHFICNQSINRKGIRRRKTHFSCSVLCTNQLPNHKRNQNGGLYTTAIPPRKTLSVSVTENEINFPEMYVFRRHPFFETVLLHHSPSRRWHRPRSCLRRQRCSSPHRISPRYLSFQHCLQFPDDFQLPTYFSISLFVNQGSNSNSERCLWVELRLMPLEFPYLKRPFLLQNNLMLFSLVPLEGAYFTLPPYPFHILLFSFAFLVIIFFNCLITKSYKWDKNEKHLKPETGLLQLREGLQVFANLRPATVFPQVATFSYYIWGENVGHHRL